MASVHMGRSLELLVRKEELNLSDLAVSLGVSRRTIYFWFEKQILKESIIHRVSRVIRKENLAVDLQTDPVQAPEVVHKSEDVVKTDYWKDKYVDLLERYNELLISNTKEHNYTLLLT